MLMMRELIVRGSRLLMLLVMLMLRWPVPFLLLPHLSLQNLLSRTQPPLSHLIPALHQPNADVFELPLIPRVRTAVRVVLVLHLPVVELVLPLPELFVKHSLVLVVLLVPLLLLGTRGSRFFLCLCRVLRVVVLLLVGWWASWRSILIVVRGLLIRMELIRALELIRVATRLEFILIGRRILILTPRLELILTGGRKLVLITVELIVALELVLVSMIVLRVVIVILRLLVEVLLVVVVIESVLHVPVVHASSLTAFATPLVVVLLSILVVVKPATTTTSVPSSPSSSSGHVVVVIITTTTTTTAIILVAPKLPLVLESIVVHLVVVVVIIVVRMVVHVVPLVLIPSTIIGRIIVASSPSSSSLLVIVELMIRTIKVKVLTLTIVWLLIATGLLIVMRRWLSWRRLLTTS